MKLAEICSTDAPDIIKISDIKSSTMQNVLDFIYSGKLEFTADDVNNLLDASRKLQIPVLKEFILLNGKDKISINNCLTVYASAKEGRCVEDLKKEVLKFINE